MDVLNPSCQRTQPTCRKLTNCLCLSSFWGGASAPLAWAMVDGDTGSRSVGSPGDCTVSTAGGLTPGDAGPEAGPGLPCVPSSDASRAGAPAPTANPCMASVAAPTDPAAAALPAALLAACASSWAGTGSKSAAVSPGVAGGKLEEGSRALLGVRGSSARMQGQGMMPL